MKDKSSRKKNALNSRALGFYLPRPRRFRAPSPEVPESGSLEPQRQLNPEVPRKFSEVLGSAKTVQRRRARLSNNMFPRHLTLLCRSRIIQ
jgi:hypothetical protein